MNDNLSNIKAQLATKADKAEVTKLNEQVVELDERLTAVENGLREAPTPAQPSLPITRETEQQMVDRATNEIEEHNERENSVIIFKVPEAKSNLKVECRRHDLEMILDMCGHCAEFESGDIVDMKRLGKNGADSSRPTIVKFRDKNVKAHLMNNFSKLKNAEAPFNQMRVQHDMTPSVRENEMKLINEAKEKSAMAEEKNFYVVRGLPGNRKVVRVQKKTAHSWGQKRGTGWGEKGGGIKCENICVNSVNNVNRENMATMATNRIHIVMTNADVFTRDKRIELKNRIENQKPHVIMISEVKPKTY